MKTLLTLCLFIAFVVVAKAQDVIILKSGDEISAKVLEVNVSDIKYKKAENLDGPSYSIDKSEVFMIKYKNGTKDVFNTIENSNSKDSNTKEDEESKYVPPASNANDMNYQGQVDASTYYQGYKGAGTGTFLTTFFFSGLAGLIPAIACSSTSPSDENLMYPKSDLMKNSDYNNGYRQEAKRIKSRKVWDNFGIAVGINVAAFIIIAVASSGH